MATVPFSDGVFRLALAPDEQRVRTLLRAATELFVFETRHSRTEIALYEELAVQLMRATPPQDRVEIARMLAAHPDAPPAVLTLMMGDEPEVAAPVLAAADLPEVALLALVAGGSQEHLELIARRPRLSADVVEALLSRLDPDRLPALLANPGVTLGEPQVRRLVALARGRPDLARALAGRLADVDDADLTDLFLDLDDRGRRRVLQALEILALRDFAARRPQPVAPRPDPDTVAHLARAAFSRDVGRIAGLLSDLSGIPEETARRILVDRGGEPLAIALRAAGLDLAVATRVILFSGGGDVRDYFAVKRLVELFQSVSLRSAVLLAGRWRGDAGPLPGRIRRHVPQTEAGSPIRREAAAVPARPEAAPARRERG